MLAGPGKKARPGTTLTFGGGKLEADVLDIVDEGNRLVRFRYEGNFYALLEEIGQMPLPHYITHELKNKERYQTVYSRESGSAAAPTAGLHFTQELLDRIREMGVSIGFVTLHVGLGTFRPVKVDEITDHKMHAEHYELSETTAALINRTRETGGRVIAVGTTSCRTLESVGLREGRVEASEGWTDIFIYPGYSFQVIDGLITNFHLPESTLIMLVSAFCRLRPYDGGLPSCGGAAVPLFQLRRCHAPLIGEFCQEKAGIGDSRAPVPAFFAYFDSLRSRRVTHTVSPVAFRFWPGCPFALLEYGRGFSFVPDCRHRERRQWWRVL